MKVIELLTKIHDKCEFSYSCMKILVLLPLSYRHTQYPYQRIGCNNAQLGPTYGYTEITGETITSGVIKSADGKNHFDLKNNTFRLGDDKHHFAWNVISGLLEIMNATLEIKKTDETVVAKIDGNDGAALFGKGAHLFNADGSGQLANGNIAFDENGNVVVSGKFESNKNESRIVIDPSNRNIQFVDPERGILGAWIFLGGIGSILSIMHKPTVQEETTQLNGNSISFSTKNNSGTSWYSSISLNGMVFDIRLFPTINHLNHLAIGTIYRDGDVLKMKIQD